MEYQDSMKKAFPMNNEYENLKRIKNLNEYLNISKEHCKDIILCVAVCEEASRFFK